MGLAALLAGEDGGVLFTDGLGISDLFAER
jgi:hypothetical protein